MKGSWQEIFAKFTVVTEGILQTEIFDAFSLVIVEFEKSRIDKFGQFWKKKGRKFKVLKWQPSRMIYFTNPKKIF